MASAGVEVRPVGPDELEVALPLIAGYQRFYRAEPDDERNRRFFARFVEPSDLGVLLGAWAEGRLVGFATLYWTHSSTRARDTALMNDLYVDKGARGLGVGRALIAACQDAARARGSVILEWYTATDNLTAQRLYDSYPGAERSTWHSYDVHLQPDDEPLQ